MIPLQRFQNKTVLITGASRGIGAGLAQRFAQEGANLVLSANEPRVEEVAAELEKSGAKAIPVICDVTSKAEVERLFAVAIKPFAAVDVSIQNAGVITIAKIEDLTEAEWDKVMAVNTKGVFLCCQEAARHMRPRNSGMIINTPSQQATKGSTFTPPH